MDVRLDGHVDELLAGMRAGEYMLLDDFLQVTAELEKQVRQGWGCVTMRSCRARSAVCGMGCGAAGRQAGRL